MRLSLFCRYGCSLALAVLCCSCSTPEQRADAAFAELCSLAQQVQTELALVVDRTSADAAAPRLSELAEELRDVLARLDELAQEPNLPQEARQRLSACYHVPLRVAVDAAMAESRRIVVRHALYQSEELGRLARREFAHYGAKGVHPWPRAVYAGRVYRPKPSKK